MSLLAALAVTLLAALLQVTAGDRLAVAGAVPSLVLLVVVAWTWLRGPRAGLLWALVGGLVLDLAGFGPLGVHALAMVAAAYVAVLAGGTLDAGRWQLVAAVAALATVVDGGIVLGAAEILGYVRLGAGSALPLLAGSALYDAALAPLVLLGLARVERLLPA